LADTWLRAVEHVGQGLLAPSFLNGFKEPGI
jgi:hypothetical protein